MARPRRGARRDPGWPARHLSAAALAPGPDRATQAELPGDCPGSRHDARQPVSEGRGLAHEPGAARRRELSPLHRPVRPGVGDPGEAVRQDQRGGHGRGAVCPRDDEPRVATVLHPDHGGARDGADPEGCEQARDDECRITHHLARRRAAEGEGRPRRPRAAGGAAGPEADGATAEVHRSGAARVLRRASRLPGPRMDARQGVPGGRSR